MSQEEQNEKIEEQEINKEENTAEEPEVTEATEENSVETLERKLQEQKDKYLRLFADFDNYKKRTAKERLDLLNTAGKDIILSILPVLDDFERAIAVADNATDVNSVKEGMDLIKNKLFNTLKQRGLEPMDSQGKDFDAEQQEAITEIPAPNAEMKGRVMDVVEKGYLMNGKIIRYAKVVVGK
ncbi:MAG: nucleotide exchange factor GrpE [Chitinophagales bacterium]|nr:nucleotide exchange factor GrpE [Chitinophagales bacterium]